jgi:hypothetical protein
VRANLSKNGPFDLANRRTALKLEGCFLPGMWMEKLLPLIIVFALMLGIIGMSILAVRWARKSSRRAAFLGWGLQFLGAGVNPVPPPQVKIEEVNQQARIKKDAESGDSKE